MTQYTSLHVPVIESVASRASEIESLAITGFDALHIAAAESAGCEYLVTTDDRLLKKSQRHQSLLMVTLLNPIDIISLP
jgi:predicted nucleic acid-binding protein